MFLSEISIQLTFAIWNDKEAKYTLSSIVNFCIALLSLTDLQVDFWKVKNVDMGKE